MFRSCVLIISQAYIDCIFFFFNDTATTEIYTLSLHDALPISRLRGFEQPKLRGVNQQQTYDPQQRWLRGVLRFRSEEHTSELQSHLNLVCRLLLEKKKIIINIIINNDI